MNFILKVWVVINIVQTANAQNDEMTAEENEAYYKETYSNTACLFQHEDSTLVSADARNFTFPKDSIYFIETSCKGGLDFRQACSVETAARAHPNRQINVLFAGRDSTQDNTSRNFIKSILFYKNVKVYKVHVTEYAKGTPLEELAAKDLVKSDYLIHHASDVLRFLTLYKFGGIYLDLDVFIVKSLDNLPVKRNWIGRDTDMGLAVGLVALSKTGVGKQISDAVMKNLKTDFKTKSWSANGIQVIAKSLKQVCSNEWKNIRPANCKGFKIYEPRYFYPIFSDDYEQFLVPVNGSLNLTKVYAFHLWNYLLDGNDIPENSLHAVLTRKYCPRVDKSNSDLGSNDLETTPNPPQIRTIRVQRSKVDTLYENIEINLKEKQLKRKKDTRKDLTPRHFFHRHGTIGRPLPGKMPPRLHNKHYAPLRFILRKKASNSSRWRPPPV